MSLAEKIIPAGDLSEQISTAGTEASGTGNMKFAMNGALTIGTLDGANIELREEIGADNMFVFGLDAAARRRGSARAARIDLATSTTPMLAFDASSTRWPRVASVRASRSSSPGFAAPSSTSGDPFLHLADLGSYLDAHARAAAAFHDRRAWARMAILNVARVGKFSSDRAVREYARDIWGVAPA